MEHVKKVYILVVLGIGIGLITLSLIGLSKLKKYNYVPKESYQIQEIYDRYPDEIIKQSFVLKNPFRDTLRLCKINHSCGCIDSQLLIKEIPSGASGAIDLTVHLPKKTGISGGQTIIECETVNTKHPYRFLLTTRVYSENVVEVGDSSPFIQLGELYLNELPFEKRLIIEKGNHSLEWDTLVCKSGSEFIETELIEEGLDKWNLILTVKDVNMVGGIRSNIEFSFLKNGVPRSYKLIRPIFAEVIGPVFTSPKSILFGAVPQGKKEERIIQIIRRDNRTEPIKVIALQTKNNNKEITTKVRPGSPSEVSVVFESDGEMLGSHEGLIIIKVDTNGTIYDIGIRYAVHVLQKDVDSHL